MINRRRCYQRGQAFVEAAISLPLLVLITFGVFDIGSMVDAQTIDRGEVRAGLTEALASADYANNPIGDAIRNESNNIGIANNLATWGPGFGGRADDCSVGNPCGDPQACATNPLSSWWTYSATVSACYSVASATYTAATGTCGSPSWGMTSRPAVGAGDCLFVKVVLAVKPVTPVLSALTTNGAFYISDTETGVQLY